MSGILRTPTPMPFKNKGALMLDLEGRIVFASTYFCDLVGIEHDKAHDRSCFEFVFPEDIEQTKAIFDAIKLPHDNPFRFRLRRVDGKEVWTDIQGSGMHTAGGQVYAISATVTAAKPEADLQHRA